MLKTKLKIMETTAQFPRWGVSHTPQSYTPQMHTLFLQNNLQMCFFSKRGNLNPYNNFVYFYLSNYNKATANGNL